METAGLIAVIYLLFVVPVFVGGLLTLLFTRKHIQLRLADWLLLIAPWAIWLGATAANDADKTLSNIVEPFYLGCITVVLFATRAILSVVHPHNQARYALTALVGSCLAALGLWALMPGLPE